MSEQQKEESQKTIVSFIVGLLIGGLLVWAFSGEKPEKPHDEKKADETSTTTETKSETMTISVDGDDTTAPEPEKTLTVGTAAVTVEKQTAGTVVTLSSATFPTPDGWVGVRDYSNDKMGSILGVARYSQSQGLIPTSITLQRPTKAGNEYAIVFYTENGDRVFSLVNDVQIDAPLMTFSAE